MPQLDRAKVPGARRRRAQRVNPRSGGQLVLLSVLPPGLADGLALPITLRRALAAIRPSGRSRIWVPRSPPTAGRRLGVGIPAQSNAHRTGKLRPTAVPARLRTSTGSVNRAELLLIRPSPGRLKRRPTTGLALRRRLQRLLRHAVGGVVRAGEQATRELRAAEEERCVVLPRGANPAVDIDHRAGSEVERAPRSRAGGAGRERELLGLGATCPARVVLESAGVLEPAHNLGQLVLDRLIGADCAAKREALLGVGDARVQARLDGPDRLGRDQRLGHIPGIGQYIGVDGKTAPSGAG